MKGPPAWGRKPRIETLVPRIRAKLQRWRNRWFHVLARHADIAGVTETLASVSGHPPEQSVSLRAPQHVALPAADHTHVDFRQLVEQSVDMICQVAQMHDGRLIYEYVSPSAADIIGWTAA